MLENKIQEQIDSLYYEIEFGGPNWVIEEMYQEIAELKEQLETLEDMDMGL